MEPIYLKSTPHFPFLFFRTVFPLFLCPSILEYIALTKALNKKISVGQKGLPDMLILARQI